MIDMFLIVSALLLFVLVNSIIYIKFTLYIMSHYVKLEKAL